MSKSDGGPAFPRVYFAIAQGENVTLDATHLDDLPPGMSLRDWFAGTSGREALFLLETTGGEWLRFGADNAVKQLAKMKLKIADAILKERDGGE